MSRAFTKETNDADVVRLPDRPISGAPNLVTPRGAELIARELARIDDELLNGTGDRDALRRDRRYWSLRQTSMQVVAPVETPTDVSLGCTSASGAGEVVELRIVGEDETDPRRTPSPGRRLVRSLWTARKRARRSRSRPAVALRRSADLAGASGAYGDDPVRVEGPATFG